MNIYGYGSTLLDCVYSHGLDFAHALSIRSLVQSILSPWGSFETVNTALHLPKAIDVLLDMLDNGLKSGKTSMFAPNQYVPIYT